MKIPYPVARILSAIAEAAAEDLNVPMAISLADAEGCLQFFTRMDGTLPVSSEIAISKAYTAAALRMPTHEVGKLAQPGEVLYGIQHTHNGKIVLFGGGHPLRFKGRVAGAVGISGGTVEQDIMVAESVVLAFKEMERWSDHIEKILPTKSPGKGWVNQLEKSLEKTMEQLNSPLQPGDLKILVGAIVMAVTGIR